MPILVSLQQLNFQNFQTILGGKLSGFIDVAYSLP